MGIEKWYEVVCDCCGKIVHTRTKNKEELERYDFYKVGKKVYCIYCKEVNKNIKKIKNYEKYNL